MNGQSELLAAVARVVSIFEALDIDYFVGGSVASSVFGEPRQTIDADLIARVLGRHVSPLTGQLAPEFYVDAPAISSAINNQSSFNLIHLPTMTKVDVFVKWRSPFAASQFARRKKKRIVPTDPTELFFASPEDTVLAKLEWYRQGGSVSDRQWRDLVGVLKVQNERLDQGYLKDWAHRLELTALLDRALSEAGLA